MKGFALRAMAAVAVTTAVLWTPLGAQDRLKTMPGYDQYQKMSRCRSVPTRGTRT